MADQRTEKPTPRKLQKAREKGDFPAAREFVSGVQFYAFIAIAAAWFPDWIGNVRIAMKLALRSASAARVTPADLVDTFFRLSNATLKPLAFLGCLMLAAILLVQLASTNMGFSLARLTPELNRLNPANRLKQLPGNNLAQLAQAAVVLPVMLWITWTSVRDRLPEMVAYAAQPLAPSAASAGLIITAALKRCSFVLIAIGMMMLVRERSRWQARLRMTKQEIRDESRDTEGNPQIKSRIRRLQRDMRRRNMMREVPTATAIIVNPTHYAVALKYLPGVMAAPLVVAKGKNYLAARIRLRAMENLVPIIENPPLAQALYKSVDVGQEIPSHLYRAVAEILAYIFRLTGNAGRK